jgi:hypothetical protein
VVSASTATAARSSSWTIERAAVPYGQRTTPSARIDSAHLRVFVALPPGQAPTTQDWDALAERLRTEAQTRIDRLSQVLRELAPPA